jgi:hypothetical protein
MRIGHGEGRASLVNLEGKMAVFIDLDWCSYLFSEFVH